MSREARLWEWMCIVGGADGTGQGGTDTLRLHRRRRGSWGGGKDGG